MTREKFFQNGRLTSCFQWIEILIEWYLRRLIQDYCHCRSYFISVLCVCVCVCEREREGGYCKFRVNTKYTGLAIRNRIAGLCQANCCFFKGALNTTIIIVGNRIGDQSPKPWTRLFAFHFVLLHLGKVWIHWFFSSNEWLVGQVGVFGLSQTTSLREGTLRIQTSCNLLENWLCVSSCLWWMCWEKQIVVILIFSRLYGSDFSSLSISY